MTELEQAQQEFAKEYRKLKKTVVGTNKTWRKWLIWSIVSLGVSIMIGNKSIIDIAIGIVVATLLSGLVILNINMKYQRIIHELKK